jgi:hypothetical protein
MERQSVFWGIFIVVRGGGVLNGTGSVLLEDVRVSSSHLGNIGGILTTNTSSA